MKNNLAEKEFAQISVGDSARFEAEISDDLVKRFADVSGDWNPLHTDDAYAKQIGFGGKIAHGFVGAMLFSRLIGMHLPGKYALYLSQNILFRAPIAIGAKVRVCGTVLQTVEAARTIRIKTQVIDLSDDQILVDGEAMVRLLK